MHVLFKQLVVRVGAIPLKEGLVGLREFAEGHYGLQS